jgi:hypothetical protein
MVTAQGARRAAAEHADELLNMLLPTTARCALC